MLYEDIDFEADNRMSIVSKIRKKGAPVIIYGTGKFAKHAATYLARNEIEIFAFCDSDEYFCEGKTVSIEGEGDIKVISDNELKGLPFECHVLCGIIDYSIVCQLKEKFGNLFEIDYLDAVPEHIMEKTFVDEYQESLQKIYNILEDSESKEVMKNFLIARVTGNVEKLSNLCRDSKLYDYNLLKISNNDIIVDGGAYTGDTIDEIQALGYHPKMILAFEPDKKSFAKLESLYAEQDNVMCINAGLWEETTTLFFENSGELGARIVDESSDKIQVIDLDHYDSDLGRKITMIKMDIEGSELNALKGAQRLICKNKPKLAICIYHKNIDIIEISKFLLDLDDRYKIKYNFYLRQHSNSSEETVLYAIPNEDEEIRK